MKKENVGKKEKKVILTLEVECPKCGYTEIIYAPQEEIPLCPKCSTQMAIKEILTEGKSY